MTERKKIVYHIDDDNDQHILMEAFFNLDNSYDYYYFKNCDLFLTSFKNKKPDICLIDLNLEEAEGAGFMLIKAIRNMVSQVLPILVLSARTSPHDISYAFEVGADDYMVKPIIPLHLSEKLNFLFAFTKVSEQKSEKLPHTYVGNIEIALELTHMDTSYFYGDCPVFIKKSSPLELNHPLMSEIFQNQDYDFMVHDCVLDPDKNTYKLTIASTRTDQNYLDSLKNFMNAQSKKAAP